MCTQSEEEGKEILNTSNLKWRGLSKWKCSTDRWKHKVGTQKEGKAGSEYGLEYRKYMHCLKDSGPEEEGWGLHQDDYPHLSSSLILSFVFPQPLIVRVLPVWDSGLVPQRFLTLAIWSAIWRRPSSSRLIWAACSSGLSSCTKAQTWRLWIGVTTKAQELMTLQLTLLLCAPMDLFH